MKSLGIALVIVLSGIGYAWADDGVVSKQSKYSVQETMDRLEAAVKAANGPRIYARIDFREATGGKIRPSQLLIFGDGSLVPSFVAAAPKSALDLPVKMLVWEDEQGTVWISYNTGAYLVARHGMKGVDEAAKKFSAGPERLVARVAE